MRNWSLLMLCLCLMVTAQTLWKLGLGRVGLVDVARPLLPQIAQLARSWQIVTGLALFAGTTLLWLDLLSRMQLSLLYPMMSMVYVIAFFVGWWILGETPNWTRFAGVLVICVGITIVARTQ